MSRRQRLSLLPTLVLLLLALPLLALSLVRLTSVVSPDPIRAGWQRALDSGAYSFSADAVILAEPSVSPLSAGRTPQRDELYFEGRADLEADLTEFQLWTQGGSVASGDGSVELRIDGTQTLIRQDDAPGKPIPAQATSSPPAAISSAIWLPCVMLSR
ncbi:MAG: hypothetical protein HC822_24385 [Oscillochloris sp.]|nr:hypothetical protein [Oscillochloris sp.]